MCVYRCKQCHCKYLPALAHIHTWIGACVFVIARALCDTNAVVFKLQMKCQRRKCQQTLVRSHTCIWTNVRHRFYANVIVCVFVCALEATAREHFAKTVAARAIILLSSINSYVCRADEHSSKTVVRKLFL